MTKYFAQDTPQAGLERMMMSVPGFQKRGSGMMILSRFCYKPEDVACRYCLHYRRRSCQVPICPYIAERLQSGAIGYRDLILECFGHIPHAGLGWYVYQPTQADYRMLAGAVDEYLQVFQRQEEAQENSPQMC